MIDLADGRVEYEIRGDDSKLDEDLDRAHGKVEGGTSKLKTAAKVSAIAVGSAFAVVGTSVTVIGKAAINSANDMDQAMNGFIASTGKGTEEAERYQNILEGIYGNNYGESFEDIAGSMALVTQQMGELNDTDLQKVVENGYLLQDTFGIDMSESIRGANAMMNQFGIDSETAYNMMAQGAQAGLNQNGDLADQIAEYSVHYSQLGLSVEDMMNAMASGVKSGAYQVDYLNDAMKEFGIRSKDGSNASRQAFEELGLDADKMFECFAEGGEASAEAFEEVSARLLDMDDLVAQNELGVALFGTKWEDVGVKGINALTGLDGSISSTTDALGEMADVKYDSLGEMFQGLGRSVELLLIPLGEMIIPILGELIEQILPIIQEQLPLIIELISGLFIELMPLIESLLPVLVELFKDIFAQMMPLIEMALPVILELFQKLAPPIMEIIKKLLPPLLSLIESLLPIFMILIDLLMPIIDLFLTLLDPIIDLINTAVNPLIAALGPLVKLLSDLLIPVLELVMSVFIEVVEGILGRVTENIELIKNVLKNIIDFIKNVFTGNWKGAWENIKNIFSDIAKGISNAFKAPINFIIDALNGFIKGVNKIQIPDWVPIVGGKGLSLPTIPKLKVGMDYVPSDDYPALLHEGEAVLTKEDAALWRQYSGMYGALYQPQSDNTRTVCVQNMQTQESIDYEKLGNATANALIRAEIKFEVDNRDFARLVKDVE